MAGKGVLSIKIIGDDSGLKKTLGGVSGRLDKFGGKMQGAGMALTKGLTLPLAAAGAGFLALRNDAAELESRIEKTKIVFGEQTAVVKDWAKENAGAMGLTSNEAAGLAANFGDLLIPMGFTREAAAGMSTDVVGLSGALSAWTGGTKSAAEVSAILSKAMLGEREGLKELGVSITEAEVSARLLENGQADLTGQQLQQAKATATQQLIMEKTTDAQAAFNDGTETLAEQQLKSKAAMKEVKDALVIALMPAYKKFASFLTDTLAPFLVNTVIPAIQDFGSKLKDLGEWFSELSPKWQKVIVIAGLFVAALGPILFVGGKVISIGGKLIGVIRGMGAAMTFLAANPVVLIIIAIAALAAGLVIAYKKSETFRDIVDAVWAKVQSVISYAWKNIIKPVFDALNDFTQDHLIPIFHNFMGVTETVFKAIWKAIKYAWNTVIKPIYEALKWYITTILIPVFKDFQGIAETVFKAIWKVIKYAWNDIIKPVFSALKKFIVDTLIPKFREFMGVVETVWDTVGGAIKTAWNSVIKPVLTPLYNFIKDKLSPVWKTFSDAASTAWGKLGGIINSALRTIGGPVSKFLKVVASIASAIGANNLAGIARSGAASAGAWGQSSTNTGIARNRGGWVPGSGPDRDSVPAVLTPGEYVLSRRAAQRLNPKALAALNDPNASGDLSDFGLNKGGYAKSPEEVLAWARRNQGPYQWGGFGPEYDCSGFMSALSNVAATGSPSSGGRWATGQASGYPGQLGRFTKGLGDGSGFNIGVRPSGRYQKIGHTAGTIAGTNVESSGSRGSHVGGSRGAEYGPYQYHLPDYGGPSEEMKSWFGKIKDMLSSLMGGIGSPMADMFQSMASTIAKDTAGFLIDQVPFGGILRKLAGLGGGGTVTSGGLLQVGENGPEMVNLPRNATVSPRDSLQSILEDIRDNVSGAVNIGPIYITGAKAEGEEAADAVTTRLAGAMVSI